MDRTEKLELYKKLISRLPEVEVKGKANPYTSLNGHMFTMLSKEGDVGIRLSREDQQQFLAQFNSGPVISYGAVMRDYVRVPDALLSDTETLEPFLKSSLEYIKTLTPK